LLERHRAVADEEPAVDDDRGTRVVGPRSVAGRGFLHDHDFSTELGLRTGGLFEIPPSPAAHRVVDIERDGLAVHEILLAVVAVGFPGLEDSNASLPWAIS
jgi:hypothetical protein